MVFGKEKSIKSIVCNYLLSKWGNGAPKGFQKITRLLLKYKLMKSILKKISYFILLNSDYNKFSFNDSKSNKPWGEDIISYYNRIYPDYSIFVETGTYLGNMLFFQVDRFNKLYSIEIDRTLYKNAIRKFKEFEKVEILKGDSSEILPKILNKIDKKAIFWLDAECFGQFSVYGLVSGMGEEKRPLYKELNLILNQNQKHIIIINLKDIVEHNGYDVNNYPSIEGIKKIYLFKKTKCYNRNAR